MQVTPDDLKPASYNPRRMSDEAKKGLKASMENFNDISGITWNKNTGNIVAGHHRWANLVEEHGLDHLKFKHIKGTDRHAIFVGKRFSGFLLRVVDWDEATEKAANITANSPHIEGTFTKDLQTILGGLEESLDDVLYTNIRLGELKLEVPPEPKVEKDDEETDKNAQKSETAISAGGEKYKLVKLELSPAIAKRFVKQLARFKKKAGNSVEKPMEVILNFLEAADDDTILKHTKIERRRRKK